MAKKIADMLATGNDDWESAVKPMKEEITTTEKESLEKYISYPRGTNTPNKKPRGFKTFTFLDSLFLNEKGESLGGIPIVGQMGIVGLAGSGKSILAQEIAVRVAHNGRKVLLATSEDQWNSDSPRFDLESRLFQKAEILGLNWKRISENLVILDTITHTNLRKWNIFAKTYRYICKKEKIELVLIDSLTLLESYRGALKIRLQQLSSYNQINGITAIYINQRATEDINKYSSAGGISLSHNLDINICLDHGKVWGYPMKEDLGKKQGAWVNFIRIMDCRLGYFDGKHKETIVTKDGFLKLI